MGFQNVEVKNRMAKVDVELWDTSGNSKFDNCWPALAREAHGVMFVFHPGKYIFIMLNYNVELCLIHIRSKFNNF